MKILIAGGAGFIGSTIASLAKDNGHKVVILDNLVTGRKEFTTGHEFYQGDIADNNLVDQIFIDHPDIYATVNCAALIVVPESVQHPLEYYENNISRGLRFLASLLRNKAHRYLFSATGSVYDLVPGFEVDETAPLKPLSPYSRTKMFFESAVQDICHATELRAISLRYFNPIGADPQLRTGLQTPTPSHALGQIILADQTGKPFTVTGVDWPTRDGSGIRDYVHVWDLARAHLLALENFEKAVTTSPYRVINLGTGRGSTVFELVAAYERVVGRKLNIVTGPARPGDFPGSFASGTTARNVLGWHADLSIEQGIKDTLAWFEARKTILGL